MADAANRTPHPGGGLGEWVRQGARQALGADSRVAGAPGLSPAVEAWLDEQHRARDRARAAAGLPLWHEDPCWPDPAAKGGCGGDA